MCGRVSPSSLQTTVSGSQSLLDTRLQRQWRMGQKGFREEFRATDTTTGSLLVALFSGHKFVCLRASGGKSGSTLSLNNSLCIRVRRWLDDCSCRPTNTRHTERRTTGIVDEKRMRVASREYVCDSVISFRTNELCMQKDIPVQSFGFWLYVTNKGKATARGIVERKRYRKGEIENKG